MKNKLLAIADTVGRTLLVSCLVFATIWILIVLAKHRPTVKQSTTNGGIVLSAEKATIHHTKGGKSYSLMCLEKIDGVKQNVGWWDYDTEGLHWLTSVKRAGKYKVFVRYSRGAPNDIVMNLSANKKSISSTMESTASSRNWKIHEFCDISLEEGENQKISLAPKKGAKKGIINLSKIELVWCDDNETKITLEAKDAVFDIAPREDPPVTIPTTIRYNVSRQGVKNIDWWNHDTQWISWMVNVTTTGKYKAVLRYSRSAKGDIPLKLSIGDQHLLSDVPSTKSSRKWKTIELGLINLEAGEKQFSSLKANKAIYNGVICFVKLELILQPESDSAVSVK